MGGRDGFMRLEVFGSDQSPEEVDREGTGNDSDEKDFPIHDLEPPASVCVENAQTEERDGDGDKDHVIHGLTFHSRDRT